MACAGRCTFSKEDILWYLEPSVGVQSYSVPHASENVKLLFYSHKPPLVIYPLFSQQVSSQNLTSFHIMVKSVSQPSHSLYFFRLACLQLSLEVKEATQKL